MCAYAVSYVEIFKGIQKIIFQKRKVKKQRKEKKAKKKNPHLKNTRQRKHKPTPRTDQEHRGDIQQKRDRSVRNQHERTQVERLVERLEALREGDHREVDHRADLIIGWEFYYYY